MLIKAIDYKSNKILRAYKNGTIVWHPFEFIYLDLKKTKVSLTNFSNLHNSPIFQGKINFKIKQSNVMSLYSVNADILDIKNIRVKTIDSQKVSLNQAESLASEGKIETKIFEPVVFSNAPYISLKTQIDQTSHSQFVFKIIEAKKLKEIYRIKNNILSQLHPSLSIHGHLVKNIALEEKTSLICALSKELKSFKKILTTFFVKANFDNSEKIIFHIKLSFLQDEKIKIDTTNLIKNKDSLCHNISVLLKNEPSVITGCFGKIDKYFNNSLYASLTDIFFNFSHIRWEISSWIELLPIVSRYFLINRKILFSKEFYLNARFSSILENFLNINIKENIKFKIVSSELISTFKKVQIETVKIKFNNSASKILKLINIIESNKVNATFTMSLIQPLKKETKILLNIINVFGGQQARQNYIINNFLINYDIKYFNDKAKYPNLFYKKTIEYFNSLMSISTSNFFKLIKLKFSQFAKIYSTYSQHLRIIGSHFSEIKLANLIEGVKNQVDLDSFLFVFKEKIVLKKSESKRYLLSFKNKIRNFSKIELSANLTSFFAYSEQKTLVFLQIFVHKLFNEKAIGKFLDINYSLLNSIDFKSFFFVRVIGKVKSKISLNEVNIINFINKLKFNQFTNLCLGLEQKNKGLFTLKHNFYEKIDLKIFSNLPSFYSIQKICHFLEMQKTALLEDQIYFLEKESFFLKPNFQLGFYNNVKFEKNIEKRIYSNLVLDVGEDFKWRYPKWNKELDGLSIEQVFNFSYKNGEIK